MCVTTSGTTSWAMSTLSSGGRRMQSGHRSPPRSHTGHRPRERNRRRSPDHRHGRF
uniref:U2 small nuclear RNA auxiliary factor 1-like 4 n=1 Tax=Mus musculus TaxID=10090 RepID=E9Q5D0_MOUSE